MNKVISDTRRFSRQIQEMYCNASLYIYSLVSLWFCEKLPFFTFDQNHFVKVIGVAYISEFY